jgi:microcystin-dependent protein
MNAALQALASQSSGAGAPGTTFPCQIWADTGTNRSKKRNSANTAWLDMGPLDSTLRDAVSASSFAVDSGAANAYVCNFTPAITARSDSVPIRFKAVTANTGACTINDGLGVVALVGGAHSALQGGEIVANGEAWAQWNSSVGGGSYILLFCTGAAEQVANATQSQHALTLGQATSLLSQPGKVELFATMSPPSGYLAANGAAVSRTTFATLFNAITAQPTGTVTSGSNSISSVASPQAMWVGMPISGPGIPAGATITAVGASTITLSANATATTVGATIAICPFGVGDGSTTFNVTEMRGRVPRGWDNGANVDTGRVFGSYQADAYPSHNHSLPGAGSFFTTAASGGSITLANWSAGNTGSSGSGSETRVKSTALLACVKY